MLPPATSVDSFLDGDSEMATLIRSRDWSDTPLGPISTWPQSLRTTVSLCLASNFPINIVWGPQHTQIYNDGYRLICGDKHPASLGMDYAACWRSAWPAVGGPFEQALEGHASFLENQRMFLFRKGFLEESFFTFSLSPIRDESGGIGGLFHPVTETTASMVGARRTRTLRDLTARLAEAGSTAQVFAQASATLAESDFDLPFVLLYQLDEHSGQYRQVGAHGMAPGSALCPAILSSAQPGPWPLAELLAGSLPLQVEGIRAWLDGMRCGPYDEAPDIAFALPLRQHADARPQALMLAGVSARLPLNDAYRGFYDLTAAALRAALARVTAVEQERKRLDMLAALDHSKTVFFSNVSHEFRTPLTLMLGPLEEAIEADGLAPEQEERLRIAHRNALRLLKLVNALLDFSRIEAGRADARYMPLELASLTADLASNFRSACERAGLALDVTCETLPEPVFADPDMWEKIVLNLVSNAFKFTLEGGIAVRLRAHAGQAELTVSDTGVGIPADQLAQVFDRFHRIEGQRGRSVEGTGIGLSLVRELVQLHGGSISAASGEGTGTVFTVRLPFGSAHLPATQLRPAPVETAPGWRANSYVQESMRWLGDDPAHGAPAQKKTASGTVLLADDNADMRAYIQHVLEQGGYAVQAVTNGAQALAALRTGPLPDLLLSDVMMPELDGFALLREVRAQRRTRQLVVILLSARAGEEARIEGLDAGADDYLVKPFSARELRARVDGAVSLARQRHAAEERERVWQVQLEAQRGRVALDESESHADSLFDQSAAGFAEAGVDGLLVRVNARFCEIAGRRPDELLGHRFIDFSHPDDVAFNLQKIEQMFASGAPFEIENRLLRPDGEVVWVNKTVTPIRVAGKGRIERVLAVVLDITRRKDRGRRA
ncbi:MAG TPA: ATP-binding protein [Telluria sp.]